MPLPKATPAALQFAAPTPAAAQQAWFGPPSRERESASSVGGGASDMAPSFASTVIGAIICLIPHAISVLQQIVALWDHMWPHLVINAALDS